MAVRKTRQISGENVSVVIHISVTPVLVGFFCTIDACWGSGLCFKTKVEVSQIN